MVEEMRQLKAENQSLKEEKAKDMVRH